MTGEENTFEGLQKMFKEMTGGDECEMCTSEDGVELQKVKPLNPIDGEIKNVWLCESCSKGISKRNEVAEQVKEVLSFHADHMAEQYLADVEGVPLFGEPNIKDMTKIENIGDARAEKLRDAGFEDVDALHQASVNQISEKAGVSSGLAWDIKHALRKSAEQSILIKAKAKAEND